jgi:hypothetical protein
MQKSVRWFGARQHISGSPSVLVVDKAYSYPFTKPPEEPARPIAVVSAARPKNLSISKSAGFS